MTPNRFRPVTVAAALLIAGFVAGIYWQAAGTGDRLPHTRGVGGHADVRDSATQLWTCGMHPQVIQEEPGFCPICGMELTPLRADPGIAPAGERRILYWWDPMMDPPYISERPGKSPMGMELVPVYEDEVSAGAAVTIDPVVVQNMGVRVATVREGPLRATIRAVGFVEEAQPNQHDVNLRVSGWIERLYADTEGMHIQRGASLFELYSPELQVGVEELIAARRARAALRDGTDPGARSAAEALQDAARRKLLLWGLTEEQVERLKRLEHAPRTVPFFSPITGHLVEKEVVEGAAVTAGMRVLRIVDHRTLWLDAQVFERHLPFIKLGQEVTATVPALPGREFGGAIIFIHPHIDEMTRTALVRIELPNDELLLRPAMYATAEIRAELLVRALLVPREAVIDTGTRQIAFVPLEYGRFEPRRVKLGAAGDGGLVQVLEGLAPGERVVTSGQFLLDAESRLQEAIQKHLRERLMKPGAGPAAESGGALPAEVPHAH
jgi:Cu(I)/Ag(I) efflux system membrane fusion protein